eukprot:8469254-Alexandrium_andersonii.AAC.1
MSASLVGSEMCIRDSGQPAQQPDRDLRSVRLRILGELRKPLEPCGHSVSYTHLTLPTICSV